MDTSALQFLTFGDGSSGLRDAGVRLHARARESGWFTGCTRLQGDDLSDLSAAWYESNQRFLLSNSRGFGYWIWKPLAILETLKGMPFDSILVYVDAGCEISLQGQERFHQYVAMARESGIFAFSTRYLTSSWTKGDLFAYFGLGLNHPAVRTGQTAATILFIKKTTQTLLLVSHWAELCTARNYTLVNDAPSVSPNAADFKEHRHDQSILDLLLKLNRTGTFLSYEEEIFNPILWKEGKYQVSLPFHAMRNKTGNALIG